MQGTRVIALADNSKINTTGFFKVCDLSLIDCLITDIRPDDSFIQALQESDVELILTAT
ncbi:HTH-type transcriptional repressor glcR [Raoultella terrigena]|nr:HTH-type transcriptional repressor glcR [Raoultella terrigena]